MMSEPGLTYLAHLYPGCPCLHCDQPTWDKDRHPLTTPRLNVCPTCGSKRCAGAIDHA